METKAMTSVITTMSLRERGTWQFSILHLLMMFALASVFLSAIMARSVTGVCLSGGGFGVGLLAIGWHYANRAVMSAGAGFSVVTVAVLLLGYAAASIADGAPTMPVVFQVLDAQTRLPVGAARVRIRWLATHNWKAGRPTSVVPAGEEGAESTTDANGKAIVAYAFATSTRECYWQSSSRIFVHGILYVTVIAPGYTSSTAPLRDSIGPHVDKRIDDSALAHVTILLEPAARSLNSIVEP